MADISHAARSAVRRELEFVFDGDSGKVDGILSGLDLLAREFPAPAGRRKPLDQGDVWLISYGDSIRSPGEPGLATLDRFFRGFLSGLVTDLHILPCFPWSSDDGFSVIDYFRIDEALGDWSDVARLGESCALMLDAVLNHASAQGDWFRAFLEGRAPYRSYFIESAPDPAESLVFRPRTAPLFTEFPSPLGPRRVWTTFGADQADLNAADPGLFVELVRILLFYAARGARAIRLDAIGYLWKERGTSCLHHPKTHAIIRLWRALLDDLAPGTLLVSETNVPHADNVAYFGNGRDEVHMVYQFPLPPLMVHSLQTGDARAATAWMETIEPVSESATYFNFLSSHDGIGIIPAMAWLSESELSAMIRRVSASGGQISYRADGAGGESPYEMNVVYFEALSPPGEAEDVRIAKFLAAHAVLLSFVGVPAIYVHSLLGSLNDQEGFRSTGIKRRINREKLDYERLVAELELSGHRRRRVFDALSAMIRARRSLRAFHPMGGIAVHRPDPRLICYTRTSPDGKESVLVAVNCSGSVLDARTLPADLLSGTDRLSGRTDPDSIGPWEALWIERSGSGG